ncbi:MAG: hypothetical protein ACR2HX_13325 [Pyrinomonadaceae bacterium]
MLKIRNQQIETLSIHQTRQFVERVAEYLREQFPEVEDEPREEFMAAIHQQTNNAGAYGLITEQQIATYVTCAWLLGLDFDLEFPAAQEVLNSDQYSPEGKREWLAEWTEALFAALES